MSSRQDVHRRRSESIPESSVPNQPEAFAFEPQSRRSMWEETNYCWVVVCKNHWFHRRRNLFHGHRIPLGETDAVSSQPAIQGRFSVRCDDCDKEYLYSSSDLLRYEQELPESFVAHRLFQDIG
jgi:hypothetical protein